MGLSKRIAYGDAYWKVREEWIGDAAATFLCRLIYAERFPDLEIAQLEKHVRAATTNRALARFAKKKGYDFGPNKLERIIANKILTNMAEAKKFVMELVEFAEEQKLVHWATFKENAAQNRGPKPYACPKCGTLHIRVHRNPTYVSCNFMDCLHAVHGNFKTPEEAILGWNEEALVLLAGTASPVESQTVTVIERRKTL